MNETRITRRAAIGQLGVLLTTGVWPGVLRAQGRPTGRCHLAFQAKDRAMVEAFHKAGLAAGGTDNGAPGERPYHPGYYAAFLLDPDGNNIEAVFHGPADRSSESIEIVFES
jgi:catechol 2,3-dioxygenase-like lactoylglutathione lyase family enzyme